MRNVAIFLMLLVVISGCAKKMDPSLDDYLSPQPVKNFSLSATHEKVLIFWSYPDSLKAKAQSFLIERETSEGIKTLGYYSMQTNSLEDKDITFGQLYKYRIFAINKKGVYSKPTEALITPIKLPEVENLEFKIIPEGVVLSWSTHNSFKYNIYRKNKNGEIKKIGSTDKKFFLDELPYCTIVNLTDSNKPQITYLVTTYLNEQTSSIEGKAKEITIPVESFLPSKPEGVFWSINEYGVYISWREVPEKWIKGYKIYRKRADEQEFKLIGTTMIPLFFDENYNINNIKNSIYYRISTEGPARESEKIEIRVEVSNE